MLHGRADDVTSATGDATRPDATLAATQNRSRHLRPVTPGSWGDTDLSHLSEPPTPVTQLPVLPRAVTEPAPGRDRDPWRGVNRRSAKHVVARLKRSESAKLLARGTLGRRKGVLVLTTQRLLFVRDRGSGPTSIDFHLASVSSIAIERSATSSRIVIHCLGVVTEVYDVSHAEAQALVDEAQQILSYIRFPVVALKSRRPANGPARHAPTPEVAAPRPLPTPGPATAPATPPAPASTSADPSSMFVAHLRELAQLHRDGMLDDTEFSLAKAKLLT